jgi:hypothetical protein
LRTKKKYNDTIAGWRNQGEKFADDPIVITRELFCIDDDPERKTTIDFDHKGSDRAIITLTQEGLSDDAVYGEKRIIDFEKTAGAWIIKHIRLGFKCPAARGSHANYSGHLCS